ncbi:MAG TPA: hypothetical protein VLS85_03955, partial [Hanamia sp.]|nr:hypothetical protein [Hanamia sp.]
MQTRTSKTAETRISNLEKTLAEKKRQLEIEASLEKVRAVALRMKEPAHMLKICETISRQLTKLGVKEIRNVQTAIFYPERKRYMNYEYYAKHDKPVITETSYHNNKIHKAFAIKMQKGKGEFFISHIKGAKVKDWITYQKTTNVFIDKYLKTASSLNYYWYSLGPIALGISTYAPLTEGDQDLFKRFLKVFELAYRRYLDIEKAEAQAREAQIQLALERVRARTMAMQKSDELAEAAALLFQQVRSLGIESYASGFTIWENNDTELISWMCNADGSVNPPFRMPASEIDWHRQQYKSWKKKEDFIIHDFNGKEMQNHYAYLRSFPLLNEAFKKSEAAGVPTPERQVHNAFNFTQGNLLFITLQGVPESYDIFKRFAKVFEQTYTRFLDLQKAEAQAREAQIEAALEKVRSRSMAMHKSEDIQHVVRELYIWLLELHVRLDSANILFFKEGSRDIECWTGSDLSKYQQANFPYADFDFLREINEAHENGLNFLKGWYTREQKDALFRYFFEETALRSVPTNRKEFVFSGQHHVYSTALVQNVGINLNRYFEGPFTDEENSILKRFTKVFHQAYTRFLDLQKAEAHAREAQIELGLERVRARAMAMHSSDELKEVVGTLFVELTHLDVNLQACLIATFD